MYDTIIVGTGPAGFSAAMNLKIHNKSFLWFGNKDMSSKVSKAEKIRNYPGFRKLPDRSCRHISFSMQRIWT